MADEAQQKISITNNALADRISRYIGLMDGTGRLGVEMYPEPSGGGLRGSAPLLLNDHINAKDTDPPVFRMSQRLEGRFNDGEREALAALLAAESVANERHKNEGGKATVASALAGGLVADTVTPLNVVNRRAVSLGVAAAAATATSGGYAMFDNSRAPAALAAKAFEHYKNLDDFKTMLDKFYRWDSNDLASALLSRERRIDVFKDHLLYDTDKLEALQKAFETLRSPAQDQEAPTSALSQPSRRFWSR